MNKETHKLLAIVSKVVMAVVASLVLIKFYAFILALLFGITDYSNEVLGFLLTIITLASIGAYYDKK